MIDQKSPDGVCHKNILAVHDAMDVLQGKWKIYIIAVLCYHPQRRFSDILADVKGISNKMLSKELKEMEINKIIKRTVLDTHPVSIIYELTDHGRKLFSVIEYIADWGFEHRALIIGKVPIAVQQ